MKGRWERKRGERCRERQGTGTEELGQGRVHWIRTTRLQQNSFGVRERWNGLFIHHFGGGGERNVALPVRPS